MDLFEIGVPSKVFGKSEGSKKAKSYWTRRTVVDVTSRHIKLIIGKQHYSCPCYSRVVEYVSRLDSGVMSMLGGCLSGNKRCSRRQTGVVSSLGTR